MEIVHQLLSTLGPTAFPWPPFWAAEAIIHWVFEENPDLSTRGLLQVCHDTLGRFVTAPEEGARLRSSFMQGEIPLLVPSFCILLQPKSSRPEHRGLTEYRYGWCLENVYYPELQI